MYFNLTKSRVFYEHVFSFPRFSFMHFYVFFSVLLPVSSRQVLQAGVPPLRNQIFQISDCQEGVCHYFPVKSWSSESCSVLCLKDSVLQKVKIAPL